MKIVVDKSSAMRYNKIKLREYTKGDSDMKIKKINYYSVPRTESGTCSCCGKSIMNICAVTTIENEHFLFGTTCFDKLIKDRLQSFQRKEMNKAIKSIKIWCNRKNEWETMTEEKYIEHIGEYQVDDKLPWKEYEDINTFEEYKEWYISVLIPARMEDAENKLKDLAK